MTEIKAISLFSGAGGMDVGFKNAGVNVAIANELNDYACDTYEANHPEAILYRGDIAQWTPKITEQKNVDIVFGGPPCQGFSVAGKMDPNDDRSKLIWHFLDIVEAVQPKTFVMENVKALGTLAKWQPIRDKYHKRVEELNYFCYQFVLNAADFGVPQNRERVFFIGSKTEFTPEDFVKVLDAQKQQPKTIREVLKDLPPAGNDGNPLTCTAKITLAASPVMRKSPYAGMIFNGMGRPMNLDSVSSTLPASMGGNKTPIIDTILLEHPNEKDWIKDYHEQLWNKKIEPQFGDAPKHLRRLTINEAALIQTFPIDYIFKGSKSAIYTQIGNAVPCKLAECVAKSTIQVCLNSTL